MIKSTESPPQTHAQRPNKRLGHWPEHAKERAPLQQTLDYVVTGLLLSCVGALVWTMLFQS